MKNFQIDYCLEDSFKSIIVPKKRINPEIEETLSSKSQKEYCRRRVIRRLCRYREAGTTTAS